MRIQRPPEMFSCIERPDEHMYTVAVEEIGNPDTAPIAASADRQVGRVSFLRCHSKRSTSSEQIRQSTK
jgi:hypothetical protein